MTDETVDDDYTTYFQNIYIDQLIDTYLSRINNFDLLDSILDEMYSDEYYNRDSEYNRILEESFDIQPTLEKTDNIISVPSQKYSTIITDIKSCCIFSLI